MKNDSNLFLTKSFDERDVLDLALNNHSKLFLNSDNYTSTPFLFLKNGNKFEKVKIEKVNYLKAEGSYTKFVTETKEYMVSNNLTNVTAQINHHFFLRIHRSYVVNLEKVTGLDNDYLFFGEEHIPISRNYKEEVNKHLRKIS